MAPALHFAKTHHMTKWKYFIPVCLLAATLLLWAGAPMSAIVLGILLAAVLVRRSGQTAPSSR